jgi:endoribonuclease Dicer
VVADVLEAVLGAAFLSGRDKTAKRAIRALKLPFPHLDRLEDLKQRASSVFTAATQSLPPGALKAIDKIFQVQFDHPGLVARALVCTM